MNRVQRWRQGLSVGATVALVVAFTLFDPPAWFGLVPGPVLDTLSFRVIEMALNVALFIPLGVTLGYWWPGRWRVVVFAVALSAGIEIVQLLMPERVTDIVDVITNSTGAAAGFAIGTHYKHRPKIH